MACPSCTGQIPYGAEGAGAPYLPDWQDQARHVQGRCADKRLQARDGTRRRHWLHTDRVALLG